MMLYLGLGLVALAIVLALLIFAIRRRSIRAARARTRPTYECGDSILEWQRACNKSLEWSHKRRNTTEVK
jgi:hypothetical protein